MKLGRKVKETLKRLEISNCGENRFENLIYFLGTKKFKSVVCCTAYLDDDKRYETTKFVDRLGMVDLPDAPNFIEERERKTNKMDK